MKNLTVMTAATLALALLAGCSQADVKSAPADIKAAASGALAEKSSGFDYVAMEGFSYEMAQFVGLKEGESFAESETKINAVFKAYEGHEQPLDINMNTAIVEAGWKQILVTQDGILDGTLSGQQLLAVFDDEKKLVSYGIRIKCDSETGSTDWQATTCS